MKILLSLIAAALSLAVFAEEVYLGFRCQQYGAPGEWILVDSFLLNGSWTQLDQITGSDQLEKRFREELASVGNAMRGEFSYQGQRVRWTRQSFLIQPGVFSIDLKSSECEFKFSGLLSKVGRDSCDIELTYSRLRPVESPPVEGLVDIISYSGDLRGRYGEFHLYGGFGGRVAGKSQSESTVAAAEGEIVKLADGGFDAANDSAASCSVPGAADSGSEVRQRNRRSSSVPQPTTPPTAAAR